MTERRLIIRNPSGLHARPASQVVQFAKDFPGTIEIIHGSATGNLKSILMLLSMGLHQGTEVTLRVNGEGEEAFTEKLVAFIENLDG